MQSLQTYKTHFILICLVKKICTYRFQPGAGGHVGFLNFEALFDIFELGIHSFQSRGSSDPWRAEKQAETEETRNSAPLVLPSLIWREEEMQAEKP